MQSKKVNNLYGYSTKTPWEFIFVTVLYAIGAVSFPQNAFTFIFSDGLTGELISLFLVRSICITIPIWLMYSIRVQKTLKFNNFFKGLIIIFPFLLVAINNFPIVSLITGDAKLNPTTTKIEWCSYLLAVLGGVVLEETCFRGIILPALLRKYKNAKNRDFICVLYSATIFGGVHLVNILGGANPGAVVLQIGYSFLIGAMCAIAFLKTGNFHHAVLLHFVYNVGGLLSRYNLVSGNVWSISEIIVTAVLAILVIIYAVFILFKNKRAKLCDLVFINEETQAETANEK